MLIAICYIGSKTRLESIGFKSQKFKIYYMLEFMFNEFQLPIFILTFSISQLICIKFPNIKFFLMKKSKRVRIHHAFAGGLLALFAGLAGQPFLFNVGLGGMIQDILNHSLKILRKHLK